MLKIIKLVGYIIISFLLIYGISFLFSNTGLGPSNQSKNQTEQEKSQRINGEKSYDINEQEISEVKAASYEVIDLSNDQIIFSKRPDSALLVASLTKLMTTWIVLNYGNPTDEYEITNSDIKSFNPSLNLAVGDKVVISDLLNSMLIGSANDAALSLSHYIEKKQQKSFTELMNKEVKNLNLTDTRFSNPNGFDSETNYSSSNDVKKISKVLISKNVFDNTSKAYSYSFSGKLGQRYFITATNNLIQKYSDLYAIKTGYTDAAQGSMVNILKYNNRDYLIIVLGSPNREEDTLQLRKKIIESKFDN